MILSDKSIKQALKQGKLVVEPLGDNCIQPSSVDLHLDNELCLFDRHTQGYVDLKEDQTKFAKKLKIGKEPFILHPKEFILGATLERITLANDLVARIEGKSSLGRVGLIIHSTAGFVDAGWDGHLTLEISNISNIPITLYANMKIAQIAFSKMTTPADRPYGSDQLKSKYHAQRGVTPSLYHKNFEK